MKILVALLLSVFLLRPGAVFAQSCDASCRDADECRRKIEKCQEAWNQMEAAVKPHADALRKMEADIAAFQARIKVIEADVARKAAAISEGEKELSGFLDIAGARIRQFYKRTITTNPFSAFLSRVNVGAMLRVFAYQQAVTNEDKKVITQTALSVKDLQDRKSALEREQASLAYLKEETDKRAVSVRKLVGEATAYQSQLTSIIATLSTKQQTFLGQKLAGLGLPTSLGAGPLYCTDDRNRDPGFSPGFAFFTFGIPHRVGLNQYGAKGRADGGQSHETILQAYFANFNFESKSNIDIDVQGYGRMPLETYLLGIYEMPESWHIEALKAQAIAARSYALAYTDNGAKSICTSQSCQVYKQPPKSGAWKQAVEGTAGKVMVSGGQVVTAWYSSTDGGYTFQNNDVWGGSQRSWTRRMRDTTGDVGSFADLQSRGYDRESPCFYAAQGWRSQYAKSAWLKSDEVADIVNVILLARADGGTKEHLYQPDKPNPAGTDTWDAGRVRQELASRGVSAYTSVSNVSATGVDWGVGRTTQVTVSGNAGTNSFDGSEFKDYFNLRAPANIQIVGPLFNIEKR